MTELAPRLARVLELHGHRLWSAALEREPLALGQAERHDPQALLLRFAEADPHPRKAYTQWLALAYARGGLWLDDLSRARTALRLFMLNRDGMEPADRDLFRHVDLCSIENAVLGFSDEPFMSRREGERRKRAAARAESAILVERADGLTIAVPLTERAARWWGRDTRWCTSGDEDNRFAEHISWMLMVVIVLPGGRKLQLGSPGNGEKAMFKDDADDDVTVAEVMTLWSTIGPLIRWAALRDRSPAAFLPMSDEGRRIAEEATRANPWTIGTLHAGLRTPRACLMAAEGDGRTLQHVPAHLMSREVRLAAATSNGLSLIWMEFRLRERDVCRAAVSSTGLALNHVPRLLRDADMCLAAVASDGDALRHVPRRLRTRALCRVAVSNAPQAGCWVPWILRAFDRGLRPKPPMGPPAPLQVRATPTSGERNERGLRELAAIYEVEVSAKQVEALRKSMRR